MPKYLFGDDYLWLTSLHACSISYSFASQPLFTFLVMYILYYKTNIYDTNMQMLTFAFFKECDIIYMVIKMTDKERYRELKKENDEKVASLIDSYHFIAHTYVLKARGYAEASLDTEARIKDVLDELLDFCDKGILAPMAIPNTTEYINNKILLLAKKSNTGQKVKSIIWTTVFFVFIASFIIFGLWLRKGNYLDKPQNVSHSVTTNEIIIEWDKVRSATLGYAIYYVDANGTESEHIDVSQGGEEQTRITYVYNLDPSKGYTFYIYCKDVVKGEGEEMVVLYYGSEHTEYKYQPE